MTELAYDFTTRTRVALAIARGIAAASGSDDVSPAHIALGLIREGENPAVAALDHAGVPLRALRKEITAELGPPGHPRRGEVALPATPGEQQVVDRAAAEARERNHEYVGTEHLLLAVLRDSSSGTAQIFARRGFGFDTAISHLQAITDGAF
jgi:ATP-dependent Clp protease ATP-binding subunit ClpC